MSRADLPHPIVDVELRKVSLPLVSAHRAAHGSFAVRETIVVRVARADGTVGWGECAALARPTYTAEHLDGCWRLLTAELVPACLRGEDDGLAGHPMAKAALASAVLDARLRSAGRSLAAHLGATAASVGSTAVVGLAGSIDDLLATVGARIGAGHRSVKLKVGPGWDAEPLHAVRSAWPDVALAADANGSYVDAAHVLHALRDVARIADLGLAYLEQPLRADDLVGSATVAAGVGVPVALDESVSSLGELRSALALGAIGVLNVKPGRVGGPEEAAEIAREAGANDIPVFCGGMLETGIGRATALAVAALPACVLPADLGPSASYFVEDLTEPVVLDPAGRLAVPTGPGIGTEPDLARLEDATTAHWRATS